jgi:LPXTG-motif cell wall-anchored protein
VASTGDTAVIMAATGSKTLASTGGEIGLTGLLLGFILAGAGALALMLRRRTA